MSQYRLVNSETLETVAEIDDYQLEYDIELEEMRIKPAKPGSMRFPGNKSVPENAQVSTPEDGLTDLGIKGHFHHEDTMNLLREIFLRVDKLLKLYG